MNDTAVLAHEVIGQIPAVEVRAGEAAANVGARGSDVGGKVAACYAPPEHRPHRPAPMFVGMIAAIAESVLTCPRCGYTRRETMPADACQRLYECVACHAVVRPLPGHCCILCSYGTVRCAPMQHGAGCCK